jgi:hypothetical protein
VKRTKTFGDVKTGHVITYGTRRMRVTCVVRLPESEHGQRVEVSGYTVAAVRAVGRTFRAGALREVVIHNWEEPS